MELDQRHPLDQAVLTVLETRFGAAEAAQCFEVWARIRVTHRSPYDAIVIFVNQMLPPSENNAYEAAWLRVLLIDAVTQTERAQQVAA